MNRDELVERVAEALSVDQHARHHLRPVEWADHTNIWRDECRSRARAALAIIEPTVREECAKLAEDYAPAIKKITGLPVVGMVEAASRTIAAAIRAGAKP